MALALFSQQGSNVTCMALEEALNGERVAEDVLRYVEGLGVYSKELYVAAIPSGEVQCSSKVSGVRSGLLVY
jgi:hypothetical protein